MKINRRLFASLGILGFVGASSSAATAATLTANQATITSTSPTVTFSGACPVGSKLTHSGYGGTTAMTCSSTGTWSFSYTATTGAYKFYAFWANEFNSSGKEVASVPLTFNYASANVSGPASDPYPRTFLLAISGGAASYWGTTDMQNIVSHYNAVDIGAYLGAEGAGAIDKTLPVLFQSWKTAAAANGIKLRTLIYTPGSGAYYGDTSYNWLAKAFDNSNMWAYSSLSGSGMTDILKYPGGEPGQGILQISSYNVQTLPNTPINSVSVPSGMVGANVWTLYTRYFYDVLVNGLAKSKYNETATLAADPYLDGVQYDNMFTSLQDVNKSGPANFLGFKNPLTNYTNATAQAAWQQGIAKLVNSMKAVNPNFLVMENNGWATFSDRTAGYDEILDPSLVGLFDYNFQEATIGPNYSMEHWAGPLAAISNLTHGEELTAPTGVLVMNQYDMPYDSGQKWPASQSSWTTADWQGARYGFAMSQLRGYAWAPLNENSSIGYILVDEMRQGGGWLSKGTQPLDPPQSAAWSNGVWRRRFPNGWVLWNPRGNGVRTVTIPSTLCRIKYQGYGDKSVNTGACGATSVTLQDGGIGDGLFLIGNWN